MKPLVHSTVPVLTAESLAEALEAVIAHLMNTTPESPPKPDPHILIRQAMQGHWDDPELDAALAGCPDMECQECARIVCFSNDPMHFHHDGCPSCERSQL
jgi:hypothetical protein